MFEETPSSEARRLCRFDTMLARKYYLVKFEEIFSKKIQQAMQANRKNLASLCLKNMTLFEKQN